MPNRLKVDDRFTIEIAAPTAERVAELAQEGFRSIVNLRTAGEQNEVLSPDEEAEVARRQGLDYLSLPVSPRDMNEATAERFDQEVSRLPGPVAVHCASGIRAALFTLMHVARSEGLSGDEAVAKAEDLGLRFGSPEMRDFFMRSVDRGAEARG